MTHKTGWGSKLFCEAFFEGTEGPEFRLDKANGEFRSLCVIRIWRIVLLFWDAGALEPNGQSSDAIKRSGKYHITAMRGKNFVVNGLRYASTSLRAA
jgi:hypothetical protein